MQLAVINVECSIDHVFCWQEQQSHRFTSEIGLVLSQMQESVSGLDEAASNVNRILLEKADSSELNALRIEIEQIVGDTTTKDISGDHPVTLKLRISLSSRVCRCACGAAVPVLQPVIAETLYARRQPRLPQQIPRSTPTYDIAPTVSSTVRNGEWASATTSAVWNRREQVVE